MTQTELVGLSSVTDCLARCLFWATLTGLVAAGLCLCVAYALSVLHSTDKPTSERTQRSAAIRREAARGITEVEAFLAGLPASGEGR